MKKFLFFLLTALILCGQWSTVSARYNLGQRKAYNEIKVGDTIAIQGISDNANNGYRFIAGAQLQTAFTEDCVFAVEEGPADIRTGEPTYFLRNIVADRYFGKNGLRGTGPTGWNDTRLVSTPDSAYNFMLACAADSTQEWNGQHNFDENSTVFIYSYNNGSEDKYVNMCNWGWYEAYKIYMWGYTDTSPWDVYSVMYEKDLRGELADLVDYYSSLNLEFPAGSDPGFYPTEIAEAFITAMDEATAASITDHTDAEYQQYIDNLKAAKAAVEASYIDITDGYYFIVCAYTEFLNKQKVEKGAYVNNASSYIQWADFDPTNPDYVFKIEKLSSGNYSVQSFSNDTYWNASATDSNSQGIATSATLTNEQIFSNIGAGQWQIWNTFSKKHYHPESNGAGSGKTGKFVTWNSSGIGSASTWYIRCASDALIDSLTAVRAQNRLTEQLSKAYGEAFDTYNKLFVYKPDTDHPLITHVTDGDPDDCQLSSNASDSSEGAHLSYLVDDNAETFWHSSYHDSSDPKPLTYHYLQADISNNPLSEFQIYFMRRSGSYGQSDRPVEVNVYATADTTGQWNHTDQWTLVQHFASLPHEESVTEYYTPALQTAEPVSYIRFEVVKNNSSSRQHNGYPYFNLAEFNIYATTLDEETSQYLYSDEIKAAADALKAIMDPALEKISSNTATQEDIDQIKQATKAVNELYADTTTLRSLIAAAERNLQGAVVGDAIGQINSDEAVSALTNAINEAKAFDTSGKIDKAALDAVCNSLKQARTDFLNSINMPDPDKWYYIASLDTARNDYEDLYTNGGLMYVADYGRDKGVVWALNEGEAFDYNPFAMWHFIPVEDENYTLTYYVQNLGSGLYIGDYPTYSQPVLTTDEPVLYQFNYTGGELGLIARKGENPGYSLHAANKDNAIVGWSAGAGTASSWAFNEVDVNVIDAITITAKTNNIDVFAVPYDFADLSLYNGEDVHTYAIKKMTLDPETDITTIEFYEKEAFAAGEPCVLVIGDPTIEEGEEMTLVMATPTEIATKPAPANGIVGLWTTDPVPANTAWFTGKEITLSNEPVHITAHTGYIDATLYTGEVTGVETALTLEVAGLNWPETGDKPADVNGDGKVNTADVVAVYTFIEKGTESGFTREASDVNRDGSVNTADVVAIYTAIIGGESSGSPRWIQRILANQ
ncbi:MAG: dockerin type I repeat-containing protein [Bacteroidaceae bacterium]|nr:dockerin type I repeat-containing protein [Bacteroidaceae bacterium]